MGDLLNGDDPRMMLLMPNAIVVGSRSLGRLGYVTGSVVFGCQHEEALSYNDVEVCVGICMRICTEGFTKVERESAKSRDKSNRT